MKHFNVTFLKLLIVCYISGACLFFTQFFLKFRIPLKSNVGVFRKNCINHYNHKLFKSKW